MAIYDHKYGELSYYRVYRSWGGKEYQEYVRIKDGKKSSKTEAYAEAQAIDERLAAEQQAYAKEQAMKPEYHIRKDGSIRGLRRVTVTRQGRSPVDVFELRVNVPWDTKVKRTTISISVHGEEKGFTMAIDKVCEWYGLEESSEVRTNMLKQLPHYQSADDAGVADIALQKAKDEFENLKGGLMKGFKRLAGGVSRSA